MWIIEYYQVPPSRQHIFGYNTESSTRMYLQLQVCFCLRHNNQIHIIQN